MVSHCTFALEFKVRDYECDIQGIVNNAVYQNYLEHTRHEYLCELGLDFAELHNQGIDLVVARLSMSFKTPLKSGDRFLSCLNVKKEGIKYIFDQKIYRLPDKKQCISAEVTAVAVINGKLGEAKHVSDAMERYKQT